MDGTSHFSRAELTCQAVDRESQALLCSHRWLMDNRHGGRASPLVWCVVVRRLFWCVPATTNVQPMWSRRGGTPDGALPRAPAADPRTGYSLRPSFTEAGLRGIE